MGNNHNLFGVPHEAHIFIGEDGPIIKQVIYGATLADALSAVRFDAVQLHDLFRRAVLGGSRPARFQQRWAMT